MFFPVNAVFSLEVDLVHTDVSFMLHWSNNLSMGILGSSPAGVGEEHNQQGEEGQTSEGVEERWHLVFYAKCKPFSPEELLFLGRYVWEGHFLDLLDGLEEGVGRSGNSRRETIVIVKENTGIWFREVIIGSAPKQGAPNVQETLVVQPTELNDLWGLLEEKGGEGMMSFR